MYVDALSRLLLLRRISARYTDRYVTRVFLQAVRESLGMRIGGGLGSNEGDTPIYIANINPQGPVGRRRTVKVSPELIPAEEADKQHTRLPHLYYVILFYSY